jgi:CRP-like cAMP-binding protein
MLTVIEKVVFLQDIDAFAEIPIEQLTHIASITEEVQLDPDTTLIKQGEPAEALYFIVEGRIRILRNGRSVEVGEKDVIGAWSLFDDELPNLATAVALEPTLLLRIDREDFLDIVADYVEITEGIFKSLARRIQRLSQQILE